MLDLGILERFLAEKPEPTAHIHGSKKEKMDEVLRPALGKPSDQHAQRRPRLNRMRGFG